MKTELLAEWIKESNNIAFFGGAGVSTESGIPDFRSENGIYKAINEFGIRPEEIISHSYFIKHPGEFYKFYKNYMRIKWLHILEQMQGFYLLR